MEHLVDHLRDNLVSSVQGEHTIVPEVVIKRPTDVDKIQLVSAIFVGKCRDDTLFSVNCLLTRS
jgi:hypothetical protein